MLDFEVVVDVGVGCYYGFVVVGLVWGGGVFEEGLVVGGEGCCEVIFYGVVYVFG